MKTYEEAMKALEAIEGGADFVAAVTAKLTKDVEAEKTRGITEKKKVDNEAKGLRERLKKVTEPLGLDPESEDFDTHVGELKTLKEKGAVKPNVKTDPEFLAMNRRLEETAKKLEEREKKDAIQRDKAIKALKSAAITKAMAEKKVVPDFQDELRVALDSRLVVDDEDRVAWKGDAEGEVFTVEDGLGKFLEKKTMYVANTQSPGGGGGPGAGGGTGQPIKEPTDQERRVQLAGMLRTAI